VLAGYYERLLKLIPAEVVGLYLIGVGIIPSGVRIGLAAWAAACLALVVLVRAGATRDPGASLGPQWAAVVVAAVSFVVWVYALGGPFAAYHIAIPWVGSLAVLVWTFVVPYFYRG
jgi:hypothetical protein